MSWSAYWRPGEQDYLVEGEPDQPLIVVRPRLDIPDGREDARVIAEHLAGTLTVLERTLRGRT